MIIEVRTVEMKPWVEFFYVTILQLVAAGTALNCILERTIGLTGGKHECK